MLSLLCWTEVQHFRFGLADNLYHMGTAGSGPAGEKLLQ